jgi:hypothetical protein
LTCRLPPGTSLVAKLYDWPAGKEIHTIHHTEFEPQSFNPAAAPTKPTRFAPIHDSSGKPVPYLYGGSSLEGAIFETIFHNVPIDAPDKFVDLDEFGNRSHGVVIPAQGRGRGREGARVAVAQGRGRGREATEEKWRGGRGSWAGREVAGARWPVLVGRREAAGARQRGMRARRGQVAGACGVYAGRVGRAGSRGAGQPAWPRSFTQRDSDDYSPQH